jgi:hypothetical protein
MTAQLSEHERYVAKVNNLVASGRDDMIEEMVGQYVRREMSGRDAFWFGSTPGWPTGRRR